MRSIHSFIYWNICFYFYGCFYLNYRNLSFNGFSLYLVNNSFPFKIGTKQLYIFFYTKIFCYLNYPEKIEFIFFYLYYYFFLSRFFRLANPWPDCIPSSSFFAWCAWRCMYWKLDFVFFSSTWLTRRFGRWGSLRSSCAVSWFFFSFVFLFSSCY